MKVIDEKIICLLKGEYVCHLANHSWGDEIVLMEKTGIAMARVYWYCDDETTVYLDWLSVSCESRNKGIATKLQVVREKIGKIIGAKYCRLLVEKNKWMHGWYQRRGYTDYQVHDDEDEWVWMEKSL